MLGVRLSICWKTLHPFFFFFFFFFFVFVVFFAGTPEAALIKRIFEGRQVQTRKCEKCGTQLVQVDESFLCMRLQTKDNATTKNSLTECLQVNPLIS